jgi:hypothetical protein
MSKETTEEAKLEKLTKELLREVRAITLESGAQGSKKIKDLIEKVIAKEDF